jgi:CubicO group peptidase (beta-lactamase class C family)
MLCRLELRGHFGGAGNVYFRQAHSIKRWVLGSSAPASQTQELQMARTGGFSRARLDRMHDVLAGHVARGVVPGIVTLVSRRGEVHVDAIGITAVGSATPMRRDTIFRIASMTKPIMAAATMVLVEDCRLRLDDAVDDWLPELAGRKVLSRPDAPLDDTVPAKRPISLRDLLTLRMGLGFIEPSLRCPIQQAFDESGLAPGPTPPALSPDEFMQRLGGLPLMHQPGQHWMYQTGFDVLNVLLARVSGQPLETFLRERLLGALGMNDTHFSLPATKLDRLATCYQADAASGELAVFDEPRSGFWSRPPLFPQELVSTVDDYLAFGEMMLKYGQHRGERVLSRHSVETMTTDQLTEAQKADADARFILGENRGWGLGLSVVTRRSDIAAVPGQFGWDGGYGTSWASDPAEELVAIFMSQRLWDSPIPQTIHRDFWTSTYLAIED